MSYIVEVLAAARAGKSRDRQLKADLLAGSSAIDKARHLSFWEWENGSTPFFWRWRPEIKVDTRDGTPLFVKGKLPS